MAAILADSDSSHAEDTIMSDIFLTGGLGDEDKDDVSAAEIDQLMENGNWDVSVVFVVFYL